MLKKHLSKWNFKNLSIGKKFTVSLILMLILPLIVLILLMNWSLINYINEQNLKTNLEVLKQNKTPIDYMIQDLTYISMQVIGNDSLQRYLDANKNDKALKEEIRYDITQLLESKDYITRLSVFDDENLYIQVGAYLKEEDTTGISRASELKGKQYWLPAAKETGYVSVWDRNFEVSMVRAINSLKSLNQTIGYIRINVNEEYLSSLYDGIYSGGTQQLFIVDGDGNIISSANKELLGRSISEEIYFNTIKSKTEGWTKLDKNQYVSYYTIPEVDWHVVKIDTASSLMSGTILNSMGIICLILIILFGLFFYYIQKRHIITPVKLLSQDVKKFHEGTYDVFRYMDSQDEIGVLNHSFIKMSKYIEELIERVYKSRLKETEAQLKYLQSQINPHFLYNTLDAIRWMSIKQKQYAVAEQLEALANLFKHALNQGKDMTTVQEEIEHLNDYLLIQKNKFGDRLQTEIIVDEEVKEYPVLNLMLQPLVENSIIHGFGDKLGTGYIWVKIMRKENELLFEVKDNGLGTDEKVIKDILKSDNASRNALALDNINKRLKYKYGEAYGINFSSKIGIGTRVVIIIPYQRGETDEVTDCR